MMRKILAAALLAAACSAAQAQTVINLSGVESRPTMIVNDGRYRACGLRFVGLDLDERRPAFPAYLIDFNITLGNFGSRSLAAMLKTELTRFSDASDKKGAMARVSSTWLAHEGAEPSSPLKSGIAGENGLSSMTLYPMASWPDHLLDAVMGKAGAFLLGARLSGEQHTRIYRLTPSVSKEDAKTFTSCVVAMSSQLEKEAPQR